jgi:hypothetical protein
MARRAVMHLAVLTAALLAAQVLPRVLGGWSLGAARGNAGAVQEAERALGVATEPAFVAWLEARPLLGAVAHVAYVALHVPVLAAVLAWLFMRRADCFAWARSLFAVTLALVAAGNALWPTAPPRATAGGGEVFGDSLRPGADGLVNTLAAMPSGHVAFAAVAALCAARAVHRPALRAAWAAYPPAIALLVVATEHHFWLDAVAALAVVAIAAPAASALGRAVPAWAWPRGPDGTTRVRAHGPHRAALRGRGRPGAAAGRP